MSNHHPNQPLLPSILGYVLTEELYVGGCTAVYRALADADIQVRPVARPVVIKVLRSPHPSVNALVRFRNQYIIAKNLSMKGIVRPLTLEPWAHSYALVMEDVGGIALSEYLQSCGLLSLKEVLEIALQMADILHHLSQHRVLHKDINPANILIHPDTHQIWLTDFSLASLLPKEIQELQNPGALEGTLAYIAPEQTGRMNRGIDYRADFYGLGITLYELLTGALPFQHDDAMALIHCHIAKAPVPPDEVVRSAGASNSIPRVLSDIVLKLMAKNAEHRYQSALGLKHDLQQCLHQWKTFEYIEPFELGLADRCDRFLIPEKLYGREPEVEALLEAFERVSQGSSELMLVAGFSGIGKTAVVNEIHKPITRQKGYFIKGKFDQFNQNIPLSAFLQAFRSLMGQLLSESDMALASWKTKILTALGERGQVLIEVIPELAQIIGEQPAVPELSGTASQDRFNVLFGKFIQLFTTLEHPLVIFLDDLQWADSASLILLKLLMDESKAGYLLVLGAYRDNEVSPTHRLMLTLTELQKQHASVQTLILDPLRPTDINQLVADTLRCQSAIAVPLSELVFQKTQGNPFFITQLLHGLQSDGHISFDPAEGSWQCDLTEIKQLALTNDVVEFMLGRLQKLPQETQDVLELASCLSNCFDLNTLSVICDRPRLEIAIDLWRALSEGLILPESEVYKFFQGTHQAPEKTAEKAAEKTAEISASYRFLHDRVQQAAYCLTGETTRPKTHLHIGRSLLTHLSEADIEERLFDIVNHWNAGRESLVRPEEKKQLCQLNLRAGKKATVVIAYDMAEHYVAIAFGLLPLDSWLSDYQLTLEIYNLSAKVAYLNGHFRQVEYLTVTLVEHSRTLLDQIESYEVKILATVAQKRFLEAITLGLEILAKLEITIPADPTPPEIQQALADMEKLVPKDKINSLINLPTMTVPRALSALKILNCIAVSVYLTKPQLFPLIVLAQVRLSVFFGNAPISAGAYARYSLVLCGKVNDIETGYAFGQLALALCNQFDRQEISPRVLLMVGALTLPWKQHLKDAIPLLQQAYSDGIESGNLEPAALSHYYESQSAYLIGTKLQALEAQTRRYSEHIYQAKQTIHFHNNELLRQVLCNLMGQVKDPCVLTGAAFDEAKMLPQFKASNNLLGLFCIHLHKLMLCYWFEQIEAAVEHSQKAVHYLSGVTAQATVPVFYFYASLACLSYCAANGVSSQGTSLEGQETSGGRGLAHEDDLLWHWTQENIEKLRYWAEFCPMNFQHRLNLVEAEQFSMAGNKLEAIEAFDRAIAGAKTHQYIQEEALANELAAKFYLDWGKEKIAANYLQEAHYCYARWGAQAKVNDLEKRYPQLFQSSLSQNAQASYSLNSLNSVAPLKISIHSSTSSAKTGEEDINQSLDLTAVLKAAQELSESIDLDELLEKLAHMMMQTSGAERLALLLPNEMGRWQVRVTATPDAVQTTTTYVTSHADLPIQLIQYVQHTQEILTVDSLDADLPIVDPYLQQYHPRSVLCLPLLHQHKLKGLLYLQHQSTEGVFHRDRIIVLNFLCTQAATALTNAQLYQQSQANAQQLEQSLARLQASETRFRNLATNIPGVIYQVQISAGGIPSILYVSPDCEALFEVSADAMKVGQYSLRDFEHRQDRPEIDKILMRSRQTLEPFDHEFRIVTKSGVVKWVRAVARLYKHSNGAIRCDGVMMDISDRKIAELALQNSQAQFRRMTENVPGMIYRYVLHPDGSDGLTYVSSQVREIYELEPETVLQNVTYLWERIHPDEIARLAAQVQISAETLQPFRSEHRLILPSKGLRWIQTIGHPERLVNGDVIWDGVAIDISDRKQADMALEKEVLRRSAVFNASPDGIHILDRAGNVMEANEGFAQMLGYSLDEVSQLSVMDWDARWSEPELRDIFQNLFSDRTCSTFETLHRRKDGSVFPVEISVCSMEWNGEFSLVCIARDISERKRAEIELKRTNQELARATRMKDEFLANMSHELRTPLNAILGMAEGLEDEVFGQVNPQQLQALTTIEQSGSHLLELINEVLDLAKIESGNIELTYSAVSATHLCQSSLTFIKQQSSEKGVQLHLKTPWDLPTIKVDERRIRQTLINLLSNAVKFTPSGGNVTLSVELSPSNEIHEQSYIRFAVTDTGIGVAPDELNHLFQPFIQIDSALNRQYEGTGLGLTLVKRIVQLHGGRVTVTSEVGVGSCFGIELPHDATKAHSRTD